MDAWYDKSASMVINGTLLKCVVICIANVLLPWCNKTRTRDRSHTINGNKISILTSRQSFYTFMHKVVVVFHTYFIHFNTLKSNKLSNVFNSKGFFIYFEMIYYIDFLFILKWYYEKSIFYLYVHQNYFKIAICSILHMHKVTLRKQVLLHKRRLSGNAFKPL